jgi:ABC-2 type transport system permease protein
VIALHLRRERLVLVVWIVSIAVLLLGSAAAVATEYDTASARSAVLQLALATPSLLALRGIPNGDSAGSLLFFQVFAFLAVSVGLMNTFFATRHGRGDEEQGRRELPDATPLRRTAPLEATLMIGVAANSVLAVLSALGFLAAGYSGPGAWIAGAALGAVGLAFLGVGMVASEVVATSRAANSIGVVAVLLAYVLRGAGDALGTADFQRLTLTPAWPSWLSPIGWGQQTLAFTADRVWPIALPLALFGVAAVAAVALHARRDLGASLLPERSGPAAAGRALRTPFGLDWRLHRAALVGWAVGAALLGVAIGALASAADTAMMSTPQIVQVLKVLDPGGHLDTVGLFIGAVMIIVGMLAAAAGIQGVLRLRSDEVDGRSELVLAAAVSRRRWSLDALAVGALATVLVVGAAGAGALVGFAVSGHVDAGWRAVGQALAELPAALAVVAASSLFVAALPRASILLSWLVFAAAIVVGFFGPLLKLPDAVVSGSPFSHVPAVPFTDWGPSVVLVVVDVALVILAVTLVRRRELSA